jgi:phospholipid/cholesterol/gamma-HCH transport system substrate-binding protein
MEFSVAAAQPGKRAPTAEMCNSDMPFVPLAMRQHALGPNPIDPNLIAQGIPPDDRIDPSANIYGPVEGTPLPPGVGQPGPPAGAPQAPVDAPSSFGGNGSGGPSVAVATYNPKTGQYATPDGHVFTQADLAAQGPPKSWKDMLR